MSPKTKQFNDSETALKVHLERMIRWYAELVHENRNETMVGEYWHREYKDACQLLKQLEEGQTTIVEL